jgi:hypothetical protein
MTGRAAGYCAGSNMPGYVNPIPGRGMGYRFGWGRGRGRGRGWRHGYYVAGLPGGLPFYGTPPAPTASQEAEVLKAQAEHMERALDDIRKRISELETTQSQES